MIVLGTTRGHGPAELQHAPYQSDKVTSMRRPLIADARWFYGGVSRRTKFNTVKGVAVHAHSRDASD